MMLVRWTLDCEKKEAGKQKTAWCHSAKLIGYQTQPLMLMYMYCMALSASINLSASQDFFVILIGYLFIDP